MKMQKTFAIALVMLVAASCAPKISSTKTSETEEAICREWQAEIFLPSRKDTQETAERITQSNNVFNAICSDILGDT